MRPSVDITLLFVIVTKYVTLALSFVCSCSVLGTIVKVAGSDLTIEGCGLWVNHARDITVNGPGRTCTLCCFLGSNSDGKDGFAKRFLPLDVWMHACPVTLAMMRPMSRHTSATCEGRR